MNYTLCTIVSVMAMGVGFAQESSQRYIHYDPIRYHECAQAIETNQSFQSSSHFNDPIEGGLVSEDASPLERLQIKNAYALIEHERLHEQLLEILGKNTLTSDEEELKLTIHFLKLGIGIHFQDGELLTTHISLSIEDGVIIFKNGERV